MIERIAYIVNDLFYESSTIYQESITGYSFEPWHYRYVGTATASAMYAISPDETLEEYLGISGGDYE